MWDRPFAYNFGVPAEIAYRIGIDIESLQPSDHRRESGSAPIASSHTLSALIGQIHSSILR